MQHSVVVMWKCTSEIWIKALQRSQNVVHIFSTQLTGKLKDVIYPNFELSCEFRIIGWNACIRVRHCEQLMCCPVIHLRKSHLFAFTHIQIPIINSIIFNGENNSDAKSFSWHTSQMLCAPCIMYYKIYDVNFYFGCENYV